MTHDISLWGVGAGCGKPTWLRLSASFLPAVFLETRLCAQTLALGFPSAQLSCPMSLPYCSFLLSWLPFPSPIIHVSVSFSPSPHLSSSLVSLILFCFIFFLPVLMKRASSLPTVSPVCSLEPHFPLQGWHVLPSPLPICLFLSPSCAHYDISLAQRSSFWLRNFVFLLCCKLWAVFPKAKSTNSEQKKAHRHPSSRPCSPLSAIKQNQESTNSYLSKLPWSEALSSN